MSRYGWAFVNSIVTGAAVTGPDLGIVVNNGGYASSSTAFQLSGSTGSLNGQLNVTGNVIISGTLFAQQYTSTVVSSSIIYTSGSTKFGDDNGDTHQFTGSLLNTVLVSSSIGRFGTITGSAITASAITGAAFDINGGTIDNTTIGALTQSSGRFTTLSASSTLNVNGITALAGNLIVSGNTTLGDNIADIVLLNGQITGSQFDINGGTIDNTSIGLLTQSSGRFTSLSASGQTTLAGNLIVDGGNIIASGNTTLGSDSADIILVNGQITGSRFAITGGTINNTTIGATQQSSGRFTSLSASGQTTLAGNLIVDGNTIMAGDLTVSGNIIFGNQITDTVTVTSQITGSRFAITGGTINNTTIGETQQSSGKFTTLSASSTLNVVGDITGSNLLINAIFGGVRSKTFTLVTPGVTNADTTTDSDFIMLYSTSTTAGTVTLHNPIQSGKILIIRKTSNVNNITLTCSVGGVLYDKDNANTAGTGIVITAGTETNKMFVNSGTNWYEIFAGG